MATQNIDRKMSTVQRVVTEKAGGVGQQRCRQQGGQLLQCNRRNQEVIAAHE